MYIKEEEKGKPTCTLLHDNEVVFSWDDLSVRFLLPHPINVEQLSSFAGYPGSIHVHSFSDIHDLHCRYEDGILSLELSGSDPLSHERQWKLEKRRCSCIYPENYSRDYTDILLQEAVLEEFLDSRFFDKKVYDVEWKLTFSETSGLQVQASIQEGRTRIKGVRFFGRAMLGEDGRFFKTKGSFFTDAFFLIPALDVPQFIDRYRAWLSLFPGAYVDDAPLLKSISYKVDQQGALSFFREKKKKMEFLSFDPWALVPSVGFFSKEMTSASLPLNHILSPHRVADFIRIHKHELKNVTSFFARETAIEEIRIHVWQEKKSIVHIEPKIIWKKASYEKELVTFGDFGFLPHIGFFELPVTLGLAREIDKSQVEEWDAFFENELPLLVQREDCQLDARLLPPSSLQLMCNKLDPVIVEEHMVQADSLWDVDFFWESPLGKASFEEVSSARRGGEKFLITDAGTLCLHEARFEWISLLKNAKQKKAKTWDFLKIKAHDDVHFHSSMKTDSRECIDKLLHDKPISPLPSLELLSCTLRPYQETGLKWLWMLYSFGLSGLLCDDMGVGKTHQAMALLAAVSGVKKGKSRYLIICPTSLIWHWREKIQSFLPHTSLFCYVGSDRRLEEFTSGGHEVFLTTYGVWRNEYQALRKIPFTITIFDELQIAKNHCSRIWSALSQVNSVMKIGLTGTPIENQLRELKSLFDLIVPGYLPDDSLFRSLYLKAKEEGHQVEERCMALSRYVRPFVLRRKKVDVLKDLPQKVEERYHIDLLGEQAELYRQVASQQGGMLFRQLQDETSPVPYIHIFALISSLKQICNHPATYLKLPSQYEQYESGKWEIFQELLEEAIESDQKVVVFSQFLAMLDIMKLHLTQRGIGYTEIRGRTKDRGEALQRFHQDPKCRVFLGSLQAAGLGIDLTPATVVIHYDRWWNAARENQATDRVHRIGQERGVQVCKLITRNSIEERIDLMIERKSRLLEDVLAYDDHQVVKKLSRSELLELLQDLNEIQKS
jgi:superfamily II DNA or RNA helicase